MQPARFDPPLRGAEQRKGKQGTAGKQDQDQHIRTPHAATKIFHNNQGTLCVRSSRSRSLPGILILENKIRRDLVFDFAANEIRNQNHRDRLLTQACGTPQKQLWEQKRQLCNKVYFQSHQRKIYTVWCSGCCFDHLTSKPFYKM